MYAITGITGKVGGALARTLLANGKAVRAIVRDQAKGTSWAALGCDVALAVSGCLKVRLFDAENAEYKEANLVRLPDLVAW